MSSPTSYFLEKLGGALIWTPSDTRSTCTLSPFRLLDHAVISPSFQVPARSMTATHDLPWHTHLALEITLSREAKTVQCQELASFWLKAVSVRTELYSSVRLGFRRFVCCGFALDFYPLHSVILLLVP